MADLILLFPHVMKSYLVEWNDMKKIIPNSVGKVERVLAMNLHVNTKKILEKL